MDPVTLAAVAPLFVKACGDIAGNLLQKAAEKHVESFFGKQLQRLAKLGKKVPVIEAAQKAYALWFETFLGLPPQADLGRAVGACGIGLRVSPLSRKGGGSPAGVGGGRRTSLSTPPLTAEAELGRFIRWRPATVGGATEPS